MLRRVGQPCAAVAARRDGATMDLARGFKGFMLTAVSELLPALMLALLPTPAAAWGEQGHRITGLVAQQLLTPEAAAGVKALMGATSLGTASLYLDQNKLALDRKMPGSRQWHYDDRPVCEASAPKAGWCPDGACASTQILRQYRALIDAHASRDEKRFAIFALVHLVGDAHQPLHASDHEDRGGNDIQVHFQLPVPPAVASRGFPPGHRSINLHSAWDTEFVRAAFDTTDEQRIARELVKSASAETLKSWQHGAAASWLKETYAIAADFAYGQLPSFQCGAEDFAAAPLELDAAYVRHALDLVPPQLLKAGARIAYLLNRAFAK
jgi:hypothetical protein